MATGNISADQLRLFIERIERLKEEISNLNDDVKDVFAEAKSSGFDPKIMKKCIALRKLETHVRQEQDALLDTYRAALGIDTFESTPLGEAADKAAETFVETCEKTGAESVTIKVGDAPEVVVFDRKSAPGEKPAPKVGKKQQVVGTAFPPLTSIEGGASEQPDKPKRTRKVRDPSDGGLVTVPTIN